VPTDEQAKASAELAAAARHLRDAAWAGAREASRPVAAEIRRQAAFSPRIASAVYIRRFMSGAGIVVDPDIAPEARALNNKGRSGTFDHPVFGQEDVIVSQAAHPFFETGAQAAMPDADRAMDVALTRWERSAGFH
jgi:hypothetical protein